MTTPQAPHSIPHAPRASYWISQLTGWSLYVGLFALVNYFSGQLTADLMKVMLLVFLIGLVVSHLFRHLVIRNGWLRRDLGHVLPRLVLTSLLLGAGAFLVQAILHDLLFPAYAPMLTAPVLDLFGRVLNWMVLLLIWSLAYFAYTYFVRNRREEIRILRLETANREGQLSNLRAQMNPHFMFNALNGIRALIDENPEQAKRAITQLSAILRNAMSSVKRKVVPLGEEIDIVKAYLALEAMRYEERLRTSIDVAPGLDRELVPPMLLQTLVENAVRHGVAHLPSGGELHIGAERRGDDLVLTVRNSGHYTPGIVNGTGVGLRNTRRRLEMIYNGQARLEIENRDGMVVTEVVVPVGER